MNRLVIAIVLLCVCGANLRAAEIPVETKVESVGLFKNGLAIVRRTVQISEPGQYRIDDVPQAVHGTFSIDSPVAISAKATLRDVEVKPSLGSDANLQETLAGRTVTVRLRDVEDGYLVTGRVARLEKRRGDDAWSRNYQPRSPYGLWYGNAAMPYLGAGRHLVLESEGTRRYIDQSSIVELIVQDPRQTVIQRKPVLLLEITEPVKEPATITLSYLTRGMAWAPSYRITLSGDDQLTLQQHAVVKNELMDLAGTEITLISGYPAIQFGHVVSPLSPQTTLSAFFTQLNAPASQGHSVMLNVVVQQAAAPASDDVDPLIAPAGEGVDLHFQSIGERALAEGDALALEVAAASASFERLIEWTLPDRRDPYGTYRDTRYDGAPPQDDAPWDAVRFRNPLPFPMTTAPATFIDDGQFAGQQMANWVNVGQETTLRVNRALSLVTNAREQEERGDRAEVTIAGRTYRRTTVAGELQITNRRNEPARMIIRRAYSGELISADGDPEDVARDQTNWSVNPRQQLVWTITLEPGEKRTLEYRYSALVSQ